MVISPQNWCLLLTSIVCRPLLSKDFRNCEAPLWFVFECQVLKWMDPSAFLSCLNGRFTPDATGLTKSYSPGIWYLLVLTAGQHAALSMYLYSDVRKNYTLSMFYVLYLLIAKTIGKALPNITFQSMVKVLLFFWPAERMHSVLSAEG